MFLIVLFSKEETKITLLILLFPPSNNSTRTYCYNLSAILAWQQAICSGTEIDSRGSLKIRQRQQSRETGFSTLERIFKFMTYQQCLAKT